MRRVSSVKFSFFMLLAAAITLGRSSGSMAQVIDPGTAVEACVSCHGYGTVVPVLNVNSTADAHFVDLDDCMMAPAVQDIWMFLSGERHRRQQQLAEVIEGYREFCDFEPRQLRWLESLRTMRIINYAAWLARRWEDPAFPRSFTWFNTERYWADHILELREQLSALQEEPLQLL